MANTLRTVLCTCGGDVYSKTYDVSVSPSQPVWACCNCGRETPRVQRSRPTNRRRVIDAYLAIRKDWAPIDARLDALVASGKAQGGAYLVHSSMFNWHLKQMIDKAKPSNFDTRYHADKAREDMQKALAFIIEKEGL